MLCRSTRRSFQSRHPRKRRPIYQLILATKRKGTYGHDGTKDLLGHGDGLGVLGDDNGRLDKVSSRRIG